MSERTPRIVGKADARYWLQAGKLLKDSRSRFLCCKIQVGGRRESFPLRTSNKNTAAAKAALIYGDVVALGWDEALEKHKSSVTAARSGTLGGLLVEVNSAAGFRPTTFTIYAQCLRQIVSEIAGVGDQPAVDEHGEPKRDRRQRIIYLSRFDYRTGGRDAWIAKVDAQPLALLSAEAVQRWRLAYLSRADKGPDAQRRAKNSASALIRNARALFSPKALKFAQARITLPNPLPFAGVKLEKSGSTRYLSKIDAASLISKARAELTGEPFQIFCLGLLCGLRKREIDTLLWRQIDFTESQLRIEATEFFHPKSEDSIGTVDLDPELLALLRGWRAKSATEFVIPSDRVPRHDRSRANYRCEPHFEKLYAWLRSQGIAARKPLHELRKELGAILASKEGIFAAQRVLRHAQISTTAAYYADKKQRISAGLGALLGRGLEKVVKGSFDRTIEGKPRVGKAKS
jgi:integrase